MYILFHWQALLLLVPFPVCISQTRSSSCQFLFPNPLHKTEARTARQGLNDTITFIRPNEVFFCLRIQDYSLVCYPIWNHPVRTMPKCWNPLTDPGDLWSCGQARPCLLPLSLSMRCYWTTWLVSVPPLWAPDHSVKHEHAIFIPYTGPMANTALSVRP